MEYLHFFERYLRKVAFVVGAYLTGKEGESPSHTTSPRFKCIPIF